MRAIFLSAKTTRLWILAWSLMLQAQTSQASRMADHERAEKEFRELHFFAEGRGMMLSPGLISAYDLFVPGLGLINRKNFSSRWGVVYNDENQIAGLHSVKYKKHQVGVVGCVVCHSGRAAGQYVVGLGNKNIDVYRLGKDIHRIEKFWKDFIPGFFKDDAYADMENAALDFSGYLANKNIGNLTQGLVPISFIRGWFYRIKGQPVPDDMNRGQVKVPHLWGYGEKRKVGQFCDGFGDGNEVGWAIAVELAAGQTPEAVERYYPKVKHAEEALEYLLPPGYPFEIDETLAAQGKTLFESTCARCHGTYARDEEGFPVYQAPRWIPWDIVRTDIDRVVGLDDEFSQLVLDNPLASILRHRHSDHGYFSPRLDAVWARFPYLHNGSVPTIRDLLRNEAERPKVFSLERSGEKDRFDAKKLGLKEDRSFESLQARAKKGDRAVYDVSRVGHSNQGHNFFTDISEAEKTALIEYLKTL